MGNLKKEYAMLPQSERDEYHHHVRPNSAARPNCCIPLVVVIVILILSGATTLAVSFFYPDLFSQVVHWTGFGVTNSNHVSSMRTTASPVFTTTVPVKHNAADHSASHESLENGSNGNSTEYYGEGSSEGSGSTYHDTGKEKNHTNNLPHNNYGSKSNQTTEEKIEESVRKFLLDWEHVTGINQAEFAVPLFMLTCFLLSLTIVSLCCCIMVKRRENRRREVFGKIITDLQTGDSKTVLLGQDMNE